MSVRNLIILFLCQLISSTGSIVVVTLGGIIGASLSESPELATLPVSLMVVVTALTTIPASMLMRAIGRKAGSSLASLSAAVAVLLAGFAVSSQSFGLFIIAGALFGINMAFTQQYRYAAAESVDARYAGRAISLVLVGAIGGAIVGPFLVTELRYAWPDTQYLGTLIALSGLFIGQAVLFLGLGPLRDGEDAVGQRPARPLSEIVRQPVFLMAVFGGTMSYGAMTFVMTATPLSMNVHDGHSLEITAAVIQSHVLGMYLPSFFTGFLIERFGTVRIMATGASSLLLACVIGLQGQSVMHYWYALVLLGVGWNFLYIGGTTMLTLTYRMNERFKTQAVNEFCVFGTSAAGSLLAGVVIHVSGWTTLVLTPMLPLAAVLVGLFLVRNQEALGRDRLAETAA